MLAAYLANGGFIYFLNTGDATSCHATGDLIAALIDEKLYGRGDREVPARFTAQDRGIAGYRFEPPTPRIFHPSTSFPIVLPRREDLFLSVYDGNGTRIYADTVVAVAPGVYTRSFGRFGWSRENLGFFWGGDGGIDGAPGGDHGPEEVEEGCMGLMCGGISLLPTTVVETV